jgi:hypothetical protein
MAEAKINHKPSKKLVPSLCKIIFAFLNAELMLGVVIAQKWRLT